MTEDRLPFETYAQFKAFLEEAFGDPDARLTSSSLVAGQPPLHLYFAEFTRIMATLNWDDASNVFEFKNRLRDEVKDLLIGRELTIDFNDFVKLCIQLDNSRAPQQNPRPAQRQFHQQSDPAPRPSGPRAVGPAPMEIDAAQTRSAQLQNGHLATAEKECRRREVCMYCADPAHLARSCPAKVQGTSGNPRTARPAYC
ncbi:hypothetical protein V1520DRAFT_46437 [Lipomyces starkeyi]|uniref:CCHC-type domain-containing protein n=1 Tax=Lipomyces starkeyi NRRL Y-11557 TaxID=675824 RepID=A0A1E3PWL4_LIPST|nr:hypothetical protein LIPSTDRAFT_107886 [Lipomyces starkeyi NRRL Y-11557]